MKWIVPCFEEEIGEFERVSKTLNVPLAGLAALFRFGVLQELNDEVWSRLENTDSWDTTSLEKVFEASKQTCRDAQRIIDAFPDGSLPAPIIIEFSGDRTHLVAGNTRLMVSRALQCRPQVYKIVI